MEFDPLGLFNALALVLFLVLITTWFLRMFYRLWEFLSAGLPVDRILKRDLLVWGSLVFVFLISSYGRRLLGVDLSREPIWAIVSSILVLGSIGYAVYVEFTLERK